MGASNIYLSLSDKGAILSGGDYILYAIPPKIKECNPVASGDALVAGIVAGFANGLTNYESLRYGVACGTAAANLDGTDFGSKEMVEGFCEQVKITEL